MKVSPKQFNELVEAGIVNAGEITFTCEDGQFFAHVENDKDSLEHMGVDPRFPYPHLTLEQEQEAKEYWRTVTADHAWEMVQLGHMMLREARFLYPLGDVVWPYSHTTTLIDNWLNTTDRAKFYLKLPSDDKLRIRNYREMVKNRVEWRLTRQSKDDTIKALQAELIKYKQMLAAVSQPNNERVGQFRENY